MVTVSDMGTLALNLVLIIGAIVITIAVIGALIWWLRRSMRYNQFRCIIWEKDGLGNVTQRADKAGIFVDPSTKNKRFFMKRANVGLEPDNIPYVIMGKHKYVYLVRTGLKNFRFIQPKIDDDIVSFLVGEEDVNWSINAYERQKVTFSSKRLLQYLPYISLALVAIIILVIFVYFFREFGTLKDAANALKSASHEMYLMRTYNGTAIISG